MSNDARPFEQKIRTLPRLAQVAFAARCARRVQPLFRYYWPEAPDDGLLAIDRAIDTAEQSAVNVWEVMSQLRAHGDASSAFLAIAVAARNAAATATHAIARSAGYTAADAAAAAVVLIGKSPPARMEGAADTALSAVKQAEPLILADFETLVRLARDNNWTNDTPVPQNVFGPMWPSGVPDWWPIKEPQSSSDDGIVLEIEIPEDMDDADIAAHITMLVEDANRLHRALGGHGLKIDKLDVAAGIPTGVTP